MIASAFPDARVGVGRTHTSWGRRLATLLVSSAALAACIIDSGDPCGPNQVVTGEHNELCVCAPGAVLVEARCVPCGEHEVPGAAGCVCDTGYQRAAPTDPCTAATSSMGFACDAGSAPCADPAYPRCEAVHGTAGYCTKEGCTTDAECGGGYTCSSAQSPSFCEKLAPTGEGEACAAAADCAGKEASLCDTFMTQTCLVQNCTTTPDSCSKGRLCCPIPGFVNLCVLEGECVQ